MGWERARRGPTGGSGPDGTPAASAPASPAERLLALQRRAGNRATCDAIQRRVGFEFEIEVPAQHASPGASETARFVTGGGLPYKAPIENHGYGTDPLGYKIEADHGPVSDAVDGFKELYVDDPDLGPRVRTGLGESTGNLEFVTTAQDETLDGYRARFTDQLSAVAAEISDVRGYHPGYNLTDRSGFMIGVPMPLDRPAGPDGPTDTKFEAREKAMRGAVRSSSYVQATAGIDMARVSEFLQTSDDRQLVSKELHVDVSQGVAHFAGNVDTMVQGLSAGGLAPDECDALRGFLSTMVQLLVANAAWMYWPRDMQTIKNRVPHLVKMDMAVYRKSLPPPAQQALGRRWRDVHDELVAIYAAALGRFEEEQKGKRGPNEGALEEWEVSGFVSNALIADLAGHTPAARDELDPGVGPKGQEKRSVPFEMRSIGGRPRPEDIVEFGLGIVDKVRAVNGLEGDDD